MKFEVLKKELLEGSFTTAQLKEVKAIADIRMGNFSSQESSLKEMQKSTSDTYGILLHERIAYVLSKECKLPISKFHAMTPKMRKEMVKAANELYAISERWNKDKKRSRNFAVGVFHLYARLVVKYLQDCGVPVSLKTCLQHVEKFPGLVMKSFPGYVENNAISVVILGHKALHPSV